MTVDQGTSLAELMAPPTHGERMASVRAAGLVDVAGVQWLLDQSEAQLHVTPTAAADALAVVVDRATHLGLPRHEGQAHYLLARILAERGELDEAVGRIERARGRFKAGGAALQAARTDLGRMQILDDLGRHTEAAAVGEALLEALPGIATHDAEDEHVKALVTAAAWGNCGVAYGFMGLHHRSLAAYERAERGYADLGMHLESAQWQANRGVELLSLGAAEEAAQALAAAAAKFESADDRLWSAKCQGDLAEADHLRGDLVGALGRLDGAEQVLQQLGADAEVARVMLQRGQVYLDAGLWRESAAASADATRIATDAGMRHDQAHAHLLAARAALAGGSLDDAGRELAAAAELFSEVGDAQFIARTDLVAAELLLTRGPAIEAVRRLEAAVHRLLDGGWKIPACHGILALHDATDGEEAAAWLDAADRVAAESGYPRLDLAVALRRARTLRAAARAGDAASLLRRSVATLDHLGSAVADPALATSFSTSARPVYDELVHLLVEEASPEALAEAVALSDRAKARALEDLVGATTGTDGAPTRGRGDDRPAQIASYRRRLSAVYAAIHESTEPRRTTPLRDRARELETQLGDLLIRTAASRATTQSHPDRDESPESQVSDRAPGVSYHVAGADVIAFAVSGASVSGVVLAGAYDRARVLLSQLSAQWGRFRMGTRIDVGRHSEQMTATVRAILTDLYDTLVRPLDLPETRGGALMVSPDRLLHRVPFHALHDGTGYLLERHPVVVAPTTLRERSGPPPRSGEALVVGVPDERAPRIREEVARVAADSRARVLFGNDATVDAVLAAVADAADIHLACHGMYREENPLFSSLRFADRWATVSEVLEVDLSGKALTLSACESGRSGDTAEPVGMAWAFLAAGAESVVVSQWVLDDESSTEVMAGYHAGLRAGQSAADALRGAQLSAMRLRPHPYHWAPFVHVASPFPPLPAPGGLP